MKIDVKSELKALGPWNKNVHGGLIFATVIIFIYCYFGSFSFFNKNFSGVGDCAYWSVIYHNVMAFVLFFGLGSIFIKFVLKQKLTEMGLGKGKWRLGLILLGIATIIVPLLALSTVLDSDMVATYPMINFSAYGGGYIALYFLSYILYYVGWEFLFRGILLLNLEKGGINPLTAILISTIVSALIHTCIADFGKPMIETLSAIGAGAIFGFIAWRTKSIYYSLYMHALIGICTDVFIFLLV